MISNHFSTRCIALATLAGCLGCGGDLSLPGSQSSTFALSIFGGNEQTGTVGQELEDPLVVKLVGDGDLPLSGRRVAFVSPDPANARFDPDTAVTNSDGLAQTSWIMGTTSGDYRAEARVILPDVSEPPVARFDASAVAAAADTLGALSPLSQPGRRNEGLPDPLTVIVVDRYGNPVAGVAIQWEVAAGKGETSESETATGADGTSAVVWTLGDRPGVQVVPARVKQGDIVGSPLTFTATVLF
jgi:hypothetical protein